MSSRGTKGHATDSIRTPYSLCEQFTRAKNNVRTTVNFRACDGKDRSNDYTSGHYDRPGDYSALIGRAGASPPSRTTGLRCLYICTSEC